MGNRKAAARELDNKTCRQITNLVYDYVTERLRPIVKKDFERHLRLCPDCVAFLNTYRTTVAATRRLQAKDIPETVRSNLLKFLRTRVKRSKKPS
jgi:hypothetical protein